MRNRVLTIAIKKIASIGPDENGAVLVITLAMFFFLFMLVSGVYTIGEAVNQRIALQNACDAASYSAAVVQADGLSRMATVNRAMAWTYVQMVRRQLDYITYRWLKLTYKQFKEDRDAAEDWHFYLLPCDKKHYKKGVGWWCGQGPNDGMDKIRINQRVTIELKDLKKVLDDLESSMEGGSGGSNNTNSFGHSGSSGGYGGNSYFNDANNMFTVNNPAFPAKKEAYEKIQAMTATGNPPTNAQIEQIYKEIFVRTDPEPDPNEVDSMGNPIGQAKWNAWYLRFKQFTEKNKITQSDYVCTRCGKPMLSANHSQCMQNMMNDFNSMAEQQKQQQQQNPQPAKSKYNWGSKLAEQIQNDKQTIEMMNLSLDAIAMNMTLAMKETARHVLEYNLPKDKDGGISSDFLYAIHIPTGSNPYGSSVSGDASLAGIFSPVYNTEEYETLFLNMMDGEVHDSLVKYFTEDSGSGGLSGMLGGMLGGLFGGGDKGGGVEQWFIRTYPAETLNANQKNIKPTDQSYYAEGISRSYKNANREEGKCLLGQSRSNHILSVGDNLGIGGGSDMFGLGSIFSSFFQSIVEQIDLSPTCLNRRSRFPETCRKVDDSVALVSQYRWCSAKWFCFFTIYLFGIEWHHPFFPLFYCSDHGYGFIWVGDELEAAFEGMTRSGYRNCFMGFDDTFILKGHARIYGDDRDLVDENYTGVPARPWLLNEKFFGGDGTISVGLARRQRNPWQRMMKWFNNYDANNPNVSNGIMSLFNVNPNNFVWTASTARAAYRRYKNVDANGGSSSWLNMDNVNVIGAMPPSLFSQNGWNGSGQSNAPQEQGSRSYDMKYDVSAWPDALEIDYGSGATSAMKKLRVGCVCDKGNNMQRLQYAWNLGTPDWDATLLPVRYSKGYIAKYEAWNGGGSSWTGGAAEGESVFEILAGLKWNGLGDNSDNEVRGTNIMQTSNQAGKTINSLTDLQKLKIY